MAEVKVLHPHGSDFDNFLYAFVGEDRNGASVTVVSALARLGLDPWKEAAELAALGREAVLARLETRLSAFTDVPSLGPEHVSVAARLAALLPEKSFRRASKHAVPDVSMRAPRSFMWIFAALMVIFVLGQIYVLAHSG